MRTRRHFQPTLEMMPCRIALSVTVTVPHLLLYADGAQGGSSRPVSVVPTPTAIPMDTDMPETGHSCPTILAPHRATPPDTILC
jgi:hypothetical protein